MTANGQHQGHASVRPTEQSLCRVRVGRVWIRRMGGCSSGKIWNSLVLDTNSHEQWRLCCQIAILRSLPTRGIFHREPHGTEPETVRAQAIRAYTWPLSIVHLDVGSATVPRLIVVRSAERRTKADALIRRQSSRTSHLPNPSRPAVADGQWLTLRCQISHLVP